MCDERLPCRAKRRFVFQSCTEAAVTLGTVTIRLLTGERPRHFRNCLADKTFSLVPGLALSPVGTMAEREVTLLANFIVFVPASFPRRRTPIVSQPNL